MYLREFAVSGSNLVFPYAVEDSGRKTRFSEIMEVASVLCVAEAERKKKAGFFGGAVETLSLLSKLHYPFWMVPWEDSCLLVDGLANVSHVIVYSKPPDVETFVEHLKRSTTVEELYRSALRSHGETFAEFTSQTEIPIEGFVTDRKLLSDILAFFKDSREAASPESTSLIPPKISMETAVKIRERILDHYEKLRSEIKGLQFAMDSLNEETKVHVDKLQLEEGQTRERYNERISASTFEVEKRKAELGKERDEKTGKVAVANEKEVSVRIEEKKKWELELQRLEQDKSEYKKRKELRGQRKDEVGEVRWDARLRDVQNQISTVKGKIKALSDFINRSNKETEKTMKNLRDTYQKLVEVEEKKIRDLESLRDSEVEKKEKEVEELQQETQAIADKIGQLIEQKKESSSTLKEATIQWKTEKPTLIYVPLYLTQYQSEKTKRYLIHPPVIAKGHEGIMMKIRKAFKGYSLQAKMNTLLKPRSKALEKMLILLEERLNSDGEVQRNLNQLGMANNLLTSPDFKEKLRTGLEELEGEGWIKPEEKAVILDTYVTK